MLCRSLQQTMKCQQNYCKAMSPYLAAQACSGTHSVQGLQQLSLRRYRQANSLNALALLNSIAVCRHAATLAQKHTFQPESTSEHTATEGAAQTSEFLAFQWHTTRKEIRHRRSRGPIKNGCQIRQSHRHLVAGSLQLCAVPTAPV